MARLFTHHDPYNIHKILGFLNLANYILRFVYTFRYGSMFAPWETMTVKTIGVILPGLLGFSSLLLPVPSRRNLSQPMIWHEFRAHSILFAMRHVVACLVGLYGLWPEHWALNYLAKVAIIAGTTLLAQLIHHKLGDKEVRTTNAMPYPKWINPARETRIKTLYANRQFHATFLATAAEPSMAWWSIIGIQLSPLMMTLVRKGKCGTWMYHFGYNFGLSVTYWCSFYVAMCQGVRQRNWMYLIFFVGLALLRVRRRWRWLSTLIVWPLGLAFVQAVEPLLASTYQSVSDTIDGVLPAAVSRAMTAWLVFFSFMGPLEVYAPLEAHERALNKTLPAPGTLGYAPAGWLDGLVYKFLRCLNFPEWAAAPAAQLLRGDSTAGKAGGEDAAAQPKTEEAGPTVYKTKKEASPPTMKKEARKMAPRKEPSPPTQKKDTLLPAGAMVGRAKVD